MVRKSSKKGWRTIKLTEEMNNMASNTTASELAKRVDTLFHEDTVGGLQGISKKMRREISLLNKSSKTSVAVSELGLLGKSIAKIGMATPTKRSNKHAKLTDLWADEDSSKKLKTNLPSTVLRRESLCPAVVPVCSAMSVNPPKEEFEALLIREAEAENMRIKRKTARPIRQAEPVDPSLVIPAVETAGAGPVEPVDRKSRAQKLKEVKHKQMLKEHEQRRLMKALRRKGQDKAAIAAELAEQAARRDAKLKTQVARVISEASGKTNGLIRGAGGKLLDTPLLLGSTEIAGSLRRIVPSSDAVLERRDSLLKRRMIEQVPETNNEYKEKVKFAKLDAQKAVKMMDRSARARCVLLG